jgi:hypothetical protein
MRVKSVHPGVTLDHLLGQTGFRPVVPAKVPETQPPSAEEMRLLREVIDREGILRRMISRE